jgi:flagellar biogenesis protein FliO
MIEVLNNGQNRKNQKEISRVRKMTFIIVFIYLFIYLFTYLFSHSFGSPQPIVCNIPQVCLYH